MSLKPSLLCALLLAPSVLLAALFGFNLIGERSLFSRSILETSPNTNASIIALAKAQGITIGTGKETRLVGPAGHLTGEDTIAEFLNSHSGSLPGLNRGLRAVGILIAIQLLVFIYRVPLSRYAVLLAPMGCLLSLAYAIPCTSCGNAGLGDFMPSLSLALLVAACCGLAFQTHALLVRGTLVALLCVPMAQALMLYKDPRLCPLCFSLAAVFAVLAYAFSELSAAHPLPSLAGRARLSYLSFCGIAILVQGGRFALPAPVSSHLSDTAIQSALADRNIQEFSHQTGLRDSVVMVTKGGCAACKRATARLTVEAVPYKSLPACEAFQSEGCFDTDRTPVGFPTFLFLDSKGTIVDVSVGWPNDQTDVLNLLERMRHWRKP